MVCFHFFCLVGEDGDDFDLNDLGNSNSSSGAGNGVLDSGSVVKGSDDANHDVSGIIFRA